MRNNFFFMWEKIETLYHATIEAMSNRKGEKLVTHNQEYKKQKKTKNEGYMHFLLGMKHAYLLTTISCKF